MGAEAAIPMVFSLPHERGTFIGREDDVERLIVLLQGPGCRLLTLLGPGGSGKTRLAIETARTFAERESTSVCFVALQPVDEVDRIASAICDALNLRGGQDDPEDRLVNYLGESGLLLVLDNFEHLIEGADLIGHVLERAPKVRMLVTSRESLQLDWEWRFEVEGLPAPVRGSRADPMSFPAVRLFIDRAKRVLPNFNPSEAETADVVRICSMVQGSPLAIELAAAWSRTLAVADIASEIDRNIEFLSTQMRDVPQRHRSMLAVFNQSWDSMSAEDQTVFRRLSVFRGGFSREAAAEVAGASITTLSSLVDRSLIRQTAPGRFQVHEVLRQFAANKLEEGVEDALATFKRHTVFYSSLLRDRSLSLFGRHHDTASEDIRQDLDNLLTAFQRALEDSDYGAIAQSYHAIGNYFEVSALYSEGYDALSRAVRVVRQSRAASERELLARILVDLGWNALRVGEIGQARACFEESIALHEALGLAPGPGQATEPRTGLGVVELVRGNFEAARRLGRDALRVCEESGHEFNVPYACYLLTSAHQQLGNIAEARVFAARAYEQAKANDDVWFLAYCLNELGNVAAATGDLEAARGHYSESYEIRREFDDPEGMAVALNCLGKTALLAEDPAGAAAHFTRSLSIYRQLADRGGLATSLNGLGEAMAALGRLAEAASYLREAINTALPMGFIPLTLASILCGAEVLVRGEKTAIAIETLRWLQAQDGADDATRARAGRLLSHLGAPQEQASGVVQRTTFEMAALVETGLIGLTDSRSSAAMQDRLLEPLSEREKEVLVCISRGMSNREIAEQLFLSVGTVKAHSHNIYEKLDASNRVQALTRAKELGILPA